jgi:hypothetical protein
MTSNTHVELLEDYTLPDWSRRWGSGFLGITVALVADSYAEAASQAARAGRLYPLRATAPASADVAPDASVQLRAQERSIPSEVGEPVHSSLLPAARRAWTLWSQHPITTIAEELQRLLPGTSAIVDTESSLYAGHWSAFTVRIDGLPVAQGAALGSFVMGSSTLGMTGTSLNALAAIRRVISSYKPVDWVCWDIVLISPTDEQFRIQVYPRLADPNYIFYTP